MFVVALKEAGLGFEKSDVRRLALVSVSRGARGGYGGRVDVVMPWSGQLTMAREARKEHTFLPMGTFLIEGEGGACFSRV